MRKNRTKRLIRALILTVLIGIAFGAQAYAKAPKPHPENIAPAAGGAQDNSPMAAGAKNFIAGMGQQALNFLRDDKLDQNGKTDRFRKLLQSSFDMNTIGRFTLGQYWRQMSPQQQQEYLSLFRDYVVKVYSARFNEYSGQDFQVTGAHPATDTDTMVSSSIVPSQGEPVSVDWRVRYKGGHYQIVDVMVEGVSMSITQQSDFAAVIQKGGGNVSALLQQLRQDAG